MLFWLLFSIFSSLTSSSPLTGYSNSGNFFEALVNGFQVVSEDKDVWEWHLKIRKVNKTPAIVGYVESKVPIGNDYQTEIKLLKKQGGEYRYLSYKLQKAPFCDLYGDDTYFYEDVVKNSDYPADIKNNCPLKPGNYTYRGVTFSLENFPKMVLSTGDYCTEIITYDPQDKICGIHRTYAQIDNI